MSVSSRGSKPVGVLLTAAELYRAKRREVVDSLYSVWRVRLEQWQASRPDVVFDIADLVCTRAEFAQAVHRCETGGCSSLLVLPMAYTPSGTAIDVLGASRLPIILFSSARDEQLPWHMDGEHMLANQAMHGVQDLASVLRRRKRPFLVVAGHLDDQETSKRLERSLAAAAAADVLLSGRVGQMGGFFEGMLDFTFRSDQSERSLSFQMVSVSCSELDQQAALVTQHECEQYSSGLQAVFRLDSDISAEELELGSRYAVAMRRIVRDHSLDALAFNFMEAIRQGMPTLPFLGASDLMASGTGYAGEGDVLTALLMSSLGVLNSRTSFTELYAPDYRRNQILLSHMGECNYRLAAPDRLPRLLAREFAWGTGIRPLVPVFQFKPGLVTLASISVEPATGSTERDRFQLVSFAAELVAAPEHTRLQVPYSRLNISEPLGRLLERYSHAGGTHHAVLMYGHRSQDLDSIALLAGMSHVRL